MAKIHTIESARELALENAPTAIRWMSHDVSSPTGGGSAPRATRRVVQRAAESPRCSDVDDLELDERGLCPACVVDVLRYRLTANGLAASDDFRERLQSSRAKPRGQRRGIQERS